MSPATVRCGCHGLTDCDLGPVNSIQHLAKIDTHLAAARAAGNTILTGGRIAQSERIKEGWFFEPTVILARSVEDPIVQEEIFGPVPAELLQTQERRCADLRIGRRAAQKARLKKHASLPKPRHRRGSAILVDCDGLV
ncbi:aldehyde dehydrogenase family protein [Microvirga sp. 2MCAF38]|uniref:aldehyde dehydrogenase family protein n=1 Tax=Microvirga sp. 2MCAF38 TaxID=3232989 RepID=UPI003F9E4931